MLRQRLHFNILYEMKLSHESSMLMLKKQLVYCHLLLHNRLTWIFFWQCLNKKKINKMKAGNR